MDVGEISYPITALLWNAVFLTLGAVAGILCRKTFQWRWFVIALALFNLNIAIVLNFFGLNGLVYDLLGNPEVSFNWAGKILALSLSVAILAFGLIDREAAGITLKQSNGASKGWIVLAILCAIDIVIATQLDTPAFVPEQVAYQLLMPTLEEEIFYRGIFLFCLIKAFGEGPRIAYANFGWGALISVILFGIVHSFFWAGSVPVFALDLFLVTGILGLLMAWLRLNTGSILAPMILHSMVNTAQRLI